MQPPTIRLPRKPGWVGEFQSFIMRGNVVDLAVGVIIGAAFTTIVGSLVKDIFNPVLGLVVGGIDFSNLFIPLNGKHYASLAEAQHAGAPTLNIGLFLNAVINFLIVAFVIFWVVKLLTSMMRKEVAEAPPPPPPRSEVLLEEIRDLLRARTP
ncbi:large conductance mechanosensitive channel protein MscL [Acidisphaera rubrifaciens]|uniref:Large-conductance mechanosensitive channel n=1 Tax=Acidisphaera rubrifaciens HS-AP3 TaxID=1231350 RepID=A0A0D6P5V4_9PROT|nr:large conductance mechanosensitive channel protein MscL [Acidisphaera rubrifaciens]GAN76711.1 large-conductance mechanosensitive channel [Acidisphaera rubrifaciens HS-AP3]